jgi:hypothetical protein
MRFICGLVLDNNSSVFLAVTPDELKKS